MTTSRGTWPVEARPVPYRASPVSVDKSGREWKDPREVCLGREKRCGGSQPANGSTEQGQTGSSATGQDRAGQAAGITPSASTIMSRVMHVPRLLLVGLLLGVIGVRAEPGWTPLWNGTDFDGWTTWMQQPAPTS